MEMRDEVKIDVRESATYQRILRLIVEEGIANLPKEVGNICGLEFVAMLSEELIVVRQKGYSLVLVEPTEYDSYNFYTKNVSVMDGRVFLNYKEVEAEYLLILGDMGSDRFKFKPSASQLEGLARYENALTRIDKRDEMSTLWKLKMVDYDRGLKNPNVMAGLRQKIQGIIGRREKSIALLGAEDSLEVSQANISNTAISEIKEKICSDFSIPYGVAFEGASSGFSTLDYGDRRRWNAQIIFYQIQNIYPVIRKFLEIIGKQGEIKGIRIGEIENEDKEIEANVRTLNNSGIIASYSTGLLEEEEARQLTKELWSISDE